MSKRWQNNIVRLARGGREPEGEAQAVVTIEERKHRKKLREVLEKEALIRQGRYKDSPILVG